MSELAIFVAKSFDEYEKYCYTYDGGNKKRKNGSVIDADGHLEVEHPEVGVPYLKLSDDILIFDRFFTLENRIYSSDAIMNTLFPETVKFCDTIIGERQNSSQKIKIFIHFGNLEGVSLCNLELRINTALNGKNMRVYAISQHGNFPKDFFNENILVTNDVVLEISKELEERQRNYLNIIKNKIFESFYICCTNEENEEKLKDNLFNTIKLFSKEKLNDEYLLNEIFNLDKLYKESIEYFTEKISR